MDLDLSAVLVALLGGGGLLGASRLVRAVLDWRAGSRTGQREILRDLKRWRDDLNRELRETRADRDYWQDLAAARGAQVREFGGQPAIGQGPPSLIAAVTRARREQGRQDS